MYALYYLPSLPTAMFHGKYSWLAVHSIRRRNTVSNTADMDGAGINAQCTQRYTYFEESGNKNPYPS
jgi:hypothetical protein